MGPTGQLQAALVPVGLHQWTPLMPVTSVIVLSLVEVDWDYSYFTEKTQRSGSWSGGVTWSETRSGQG